MPMESLVQDSPALFNPQVLRDVAADDETLVAELLQIFLRIVPPMASRLREAIAVGHTAAIAEEAHSLRSCLATMGAHAIEAHCRQLEASVRHGKLAVGPGDIAVCSELERLIAEVHDYHVRHAGGSHQARN